jgi:hypothetical protein
MKRLKISEYPDIDFDNNFNVNILINGPILKEKSEFVGIKLGHEQFKASQS